MSKHSRLSSKRAPAPTKTVPGAAARVAVPAAAAPVNGRTVLRSGHLDHHLDAVGAYERGVEALQQRDYHRARRLLEAILEQYPDEKELHERVHLYLNVCQRQATPPDPTPQTTAERVYAATLAVNAGAYDNGLSELQQALHTDPDNDHVHYMLGVVYALRQDFAPALAHLQRAVELNAENRFLAMQDADLVALREADSGFRTVIDAAFTARRDRREEHRLGLSR